MAAINPDAPSILKQVKVDSEQKASFVPEEAQKEYAHLKQAEDGVILPDVGEDSPEDARWKTEAKDIFKRYDVNNDNCISEEELVALLVALDKSFTRDDCKRLLREADFNGDGKIQFDEFLNWLYRPTRDSLGRAVMRYTKPLKKLFDVYDKDNTGFISKDNFSECHCLLQASLRVSTIEENAAHKNCAMKLQQDEATAFRLVDKDGSGEVPFMEFVDWMKEHVPPNVSPEEFTEYVERLAATLEDAFRSIAKAEDGFINEEQLQEAINRLASSATKLGQLAEREAAYIQWSDPPRGLSVTKLRTTHTKFVPVNMKRIDSIDWGILCLPMPGDYEDAESRIWLAQVIRRIKWKDGKTLVEEPEHYAYDRKTFSWAQVSDKSESAFENSFGKLTPGMGLFCLVKTAANFGMSINWDGIEHAIQGGVDMKLISQDQASRFFKHMESIAKEYLSSEGAFDSNELHAEEDRLRAAREWLASKFTVKPRVVMATLSEIGVVQIDAAWESVSPADFVNR